ncbi:hypothetical protein Hte_002318 [Hypoxylon texense]
MASRPNQPLPCPLCSAEFGSRQSPNEHTKRFHLGTLTTIKATMDTPRLTTNASNPAGCLKIRIDYNIRSLPETSIGIWDRSERCRGAANPLYFYDA